MFLIVLRESRQAQTRWEKGGDCPLIPVSRVPLFAGKKRKEFITTWEVLKNSAPTSF